MIIGVETAAQLGKNLDLVEKGMLPNGWSRKSTAWGRRLNTPSIPGSGRAEGSLMEKGNTLPISKADIRLAMLGMVDGDGHPSSWSAIFNGYDPAEMAKCPYPVIPAYLSKQPPGAFGVGGARVTHIWTDNPEDAARVARASLIPDILARPETRSAGWTPW